MSQETALAFVKAINTHDVDGILALMGNDHVFVDAYGDRQTRVEMETGWPGYFAWFPDYHIEVEQVLEDGDTTVLLGHAGGSWQGRSGPDGEDHWRLPAAWRVTAQSGKVKVWQVYCDSKIPFAIIERHTPLAGEEP